MPRAGPSGEAGCPDVTGAPPPWDDVTNDTWKSWGWGGRALVALLEPELAEEDDLHAVQFKPAPTM